MSLKPIAVFCVLGLTGGVCAQVWSPLPAFQSKLGGGFQNSFGGAPSARYQFVDGNFRNTVIVLKKISIRAMSEYDTYGIAGSKRSWKNVTLDLGPTDWTKIPSSVAVFSLNYTGAPTRCFSSSVTWPELRGRTPKPLTNFPIQFPFSRIYVHAGAGVRDFLADFRMSGGTSPKYSSYYTDGYRVPIRVCGTIRRWQASGAGCIDPNARPRTGQTRARAWISICRHTAASPYSTYRNRVYFSSYTGNVAPRKSFMNVVDFAGIPTGVPVGAPCERLFLRLTPTAVYFPLVADGYGHSPAHDLGLPNGVPFRPALVGIEVFTQSAWNDSRTNALKLTAATSAAVPAVALDGYDAAKRACISGKLQDLNGFVRRHPNTNPIFRYN